MNSTLKKVAILFFVFAASISSAIAQKTVIEGVVFDENTKEKLPFVNIVFEGTTIGTATDLEGFYRLETKDLSLDKVIVSFLGYEKKMVTIEPGVKQSLQINLKLSGQDLVEIVVKEKRKSKKDTAALRIFRNVLKNKSKNRITSVDSYEYEEYQKTQFDLFNISDRIKNAKILRPFEYYITNTDTTNNGIEFLPFLIKERLSNFYFLKEPKKQSKQVILGDKTTAVVENNITDVLNYAFDPIDIYDNMFLINNQSFMSPFSNTARTYYNYYLTDSTGTGKNKSYKLEFTGRRKQDLAFTGYAWIENGSYAITDIQLYLMPKVNINFVNDFGLKQSFTNIDGLWFKTKESIFTSINVSKNKDKQSFMVSKNISRKKIVLNQPVDEDVFDGDPITTLQYAKVKEEDYWEDKRHVSLSEKESDIIESIDSVKNSRAYRRMRWATYLLSSAYAKVGPIEFGRIYQYFSWNEIEGNRYKFEARTNWDFNKRLQLEGYLAYGDKDKQFKYGGAWRLHLKRKNNKWHMTGGHFKNDIIQLDQRDILLTHDNLVLAILRTDPLSKLLKVQRYNYYHEKEWRKRFFTMLGFTHQRITAVSEELKFKQKVETNENRDTIPIDDITTAELNLGFKWANKQKYHEGRFVLSPLSYNHPVFTLDYNIGVKNIFKSDYNYHKLEASVRHRWDNVLGSTYYHATAGKVFGRAPYPILKMFKGNQSWIGRYWAFELMSEFEYLSDEYAMIWLRHDFNGLIMNTIPLIKKLKWRALVHSKAAIGRLNVENQDLVLLPPGLSPLDGVYLEAGFGFENIFKLFRVIAVWRLKPKVNPLRDDIATFGLKLTVHPSL